MTFNDDNRRETRAACGVFLLVAFADANFDGAEEARLLGGLANTPPFKSFKTTLFEAEYNALIAAIKTDYTAVKATILEDVRWAASDQRLIEIIKMSARAAIVADNRVTPQEEAAIAEIETALGFDKGVI